MIAANFLHSFRPRNNTSAATFRRVMLISCGGQRSPCRCNFASPMPAALLVRSTIQKSSRTIARLQWPSRLGGCKPISRKCACASSSSKEGRNSRERARLHARYRRNATWAFSRTMKIPSIVRFSHERRRFHSTWYSSTLIIRIEIIAHLIYITSRKW